MSVTLRVTRWSGAGHGFLSLNMAISRQSLLRPTTASLAATA
jgi:hypothetical protein